MLGQTSNMTIVCSKIEVTKKKGLYRAARYNISCRDFFGTLKSAKEVRAFNTLLHRTLFKSDVEFRSYCTKYSQGSRVGGIG